MVAGKLLLLVGLALLVYTGYQAMTCEHLDHLEQSRSARDTVRLAVGAAAAAAACWARQRRSLSSALL